MAIPPERMSHIALVKALKECQEDLRRKDSTISDQLDRGAHTRYALDRAYKTIQVSKKKKGKLDAMSKKHIANEAIHTIVQNLLSMPIAVLGSMAADEYTIWIPIMGCTNAIFGPLTMMVQKLKEEH